MLYIISTKFSGTPIVPCRFHPHSFPPDFCFFLSHSPNINHESRSFTAFCCLRSYDSHFSLRFKESLFLLCRDLASIFEVQSPHVLTRIFLIGYPPILDMVYVNRSRCLQAIKIPPNFKTKSESVQSMTKQLTETSFFLFGGLVLPMNI